MHSKHAFSTLSFHAVLIRINFKGVHTVSIQLHPENDFSMLIFAYIEVLIVRMCVFGAGPLHLSVSLAYQYNK